MELLTKNNQTCIYKGSLGIQMGCFGGPAKGTEPKQLSAVQKHWNSITINIRLIKIFMITTAVEVYWNSITINIGLIKISMITT